MPGNSPTPALRSQNKCVRWSPDWRNYSRKTRPKGQLIKKDGVTVGSRILAQPFSAAGYFHARPSAAGTKGYDATNSGGTNWGPTNQQLIDRVKNDTSSLQSENPGKPVPVDLVTASGSGLDQHIMPAAAEFQVARVARSRGSHRTQYSQIVDRAH
jgi:potassium-transporting ATPase KdpC subunit